MKIAWISSWPPTECGIAGYSKEYVEALREAGAEVEIISHVTSYRPSKRVHAVIDLRNGQWYKKVARQIKAIAPDIVHIQHEYGLYDVADKNQGVLELLKLVRKYPRVMTYHSVYSKLSPEHASFMSESLKLLDAGIVHCNYQKEALPRNIGWSPENVHVLTHGCREDLYLNKLKCKRKFGYKDKLIVGLSGWWAANKHFDKTISRWHLISKKIPDSLLVIGGSTREHYYDLPSVVDDMRVKIAYLNAILSSPARDRMILRMDIKPKLDKDYYLKASFDVHVIAHTAESQSGTLARCLAVGTPVVARDIEGIGAETRLSGAGIAVKSDAEMEQKLIWLMNNEAERKRLRKAARSYVRKVAGWSIIAKKTLDIYNKLLK